MAAEYIIYREYRRNLFSHGKALEEVEKRSRNQQVPKDESGAPQYPRTPLMQAVFDFRNGHPLALEAKIARVIHPSYRMKFVHPTVVSINGFERKELFIFEKSRDSHLAHSASIHFDDVRETSYEGVPDSMPVKGPVVAFGSVCFDCVLTGSIKMAQQAFEDGETEFRVILPDRGLFISTVRDVQMSLSEDFLLIDVERIMRWIENYLQGTNSRPLRSELWLPTTAIELVHRGKSRTFIKKDGGSNDDIKGKLILETHEDVLDGVNFVLPHNHHRAKLIWAVRDGKAVYRMVDLETSLEFGYLEIDQHYMYKQEGEIQKEDKFQFKFLAVYYHEALDIQEEQLKEAILKGFQDKVQETVEMYESFGVATVEKKGDKAVGVSDAANANGISGRGFYDFC